MSEKTSQRLLIIELIIIIFPQLILLLDAMAGLLYAEFYSHMKYDLIRSYNLSIVPVEILACISLIAVCILAIKFIANGISSLRKANSFLWSLSLAGIIIIFIALLSQFIPSPLLRRLPKSLYFDSIIFILYLDYFILGFSINYFGYAYIIPVVHLYLEKKFRKEIS